MCVVSVVSVGDVVYLSSSARHLHRSAAVAAAAADVATQRLQPNKICPLDKSVASLGGRRHLCVWLGLVCFWRGGSGFFCLLLRGGAGGAD